ncbi:MAG: hypothetical protein NT031_17440 [Planctomycetota bacterium]|nr:hypothetical protein [Planctomycetota bacterium]
MMASLNILAWCGTVLAAGESTPLTRWQGVYNYSSNLRVNPWWVAFWALLAVVSCVVGVFLYRDVDRRRHLRRRLKETVDRLKLTRTQSDLLGMLAGQSHLGVPETILTAADAFDHAAASFTMLPRVQSLNDTARQQVRGAIEDLRRKLGFHMEVGAPGRIQSSRQIAPGSKITLARPDQIEATEARVERNTSSELIVQTDPEFHARRGDTLALQHTQGANTWELIVPVVDTLSNGLILGHTGQSRLVNRRRFVRVRVTIGAMAARMPFHTGENAPDLPRLSPARLTEIAGPGICLECGFLAAVGETLVIRAQIQDTPLQTTARVRRVTDLGQGRYLIAAEMTGLEAQEVAELVRHTNEALQAAFSPVPSGRAPQPVHAGASGWRSTNG